MGLGAYGVGKDGIGLSTARERAAETRLLVKKGLDPIEVRKSRRVEEGLAAKEAEAARTTFKKAALEFISIHSVSWNNPKHHAQWSTILKASVFPVIGERSVAEIGIAEIELALKPIWQRIPESASRIRRRVEQILDYAKSKGWRTGDNPARWKESLKHRLLNLSRVRRIEHHPALPWQNVPAFVATLVQRPSMSSK